MFGPPENELHLERLDVVNRSGPLVGAPVPGAILLEHGIPRDADMLCHRVVEAVPLRPWLVPNEHHGSAAVVELGEVLAGVLHVGDAAEGAVEVYRGLGAVPYLVGGLDVDALCRCSVQDEDRSVHGLPPKPARQ